MMKTTATKKAPAAAKPKAAAKRATAKAGTGKGAAAGQTQTATDLGKQGEGTAGKTPAAVVAAPTALAPKATAPKTPAPIVGGTKKVLIEVVAVTKKPYTPRALKPELYPFGDLTPAVKNADGDIEGPSFFIPDSDDAEQKIQTARKRHKGVMFWARSRREKINGKGPVVPGKRVWRGTKDIEPPK